MSLFNKEPEPKKSSKPADETQQQRDPMGEFYANMGQVQKAMRNGGTVDKSFLNNDDLVELRQAFKEGKETVYKNQLEELQERAQKRKKGEVWVDEPERSAIQDGYNSRPLLVRALSTIFFGGRKKILGREAQIQAEQKRAREEEKAKEKYEKEFNKNKVNINHAYVQLERLADTARKNTRSGKVKFDPDFAARSLAAHEEMSLLIEEFGEEQILQYLGEKGHKSLNAMLQFYNSIPGNYNIPKKRVGENTPKYNANTQTWKSNTTSTEKRSRQNGSCLGRFAISLALGGVVVLGGNAFINSTQKHDDSPKTVAPYMTPSLYDVYPTPTLAPLKTGK